MLYTTLADYHVDSHDDVRGARVFDITENNELGTIHDVIIDRDSCRIDYLVVSSRSGFTLLPSDRVRVFGDSFAATIEQDQFATLPPFDLAALNNPDAWEVYIDRYDDALRSAGIESHEPTLVVPTRAQETEPTLWDRFQQAVRRTSGEQAREEREIERAEHTPPPGHKIA